MTRLAAALAVLLMVTTAVGLATAPPRQANAQNQAGIGRFVVVGRLIDAVTGEPIGSALVTISAGAAPGRGAPVGRWADPTPGERVYTDPDGRFHVPFTTRRLVRPAALSATPIPVTLYT